MQAPRLETRKISRIPAGQKQLVCCCGPITPMKKNALKACGIVASNDKQGMDTYSAHLARIGSSREESSAIILTTSPHQYKHVDMFESRVTAGHGLSAELMYFGAPLVTVGRVTLISASFRTAPHFIWSRPGRDSRCAACDKAQHTRARIKRTAAAVMGAKERR